MALGGISQDTHKRVWGQARTHAERRQRTVKICCDNAAEIEDEAVIGHVTQAYEAALNSRSLLPKFRASAVPDDLTAA